MGENGENDSSHTWWLQGCERWPSLKVSAASFSEFVAKCDGAKVDHATDLFLACACSREHAPAVTVFRELYESDVRSAVVGKVPPSLVDDVVQEVLAKLLVAAGEYPPGIGKYQGRGKLETWVRVVARRTAVNLHRDSKPERQVALKDTDMLADYASSDAVLAPLREQYRVAFRAAFAASIEQLSVKQRNLLRYECIDRLSRQQIAHLHGVTMVTVSRWRAATRVRLRTLTRQAFVSDAGIEEAEFNSAMNLIASQLEVSLTRLLGDESE